MKLALVLAAISGIVIPASAGVSVTLHFDLDGDPFTANDVTLSSLGDGSSASWTVWASFDGFPPGSYFSGFAGRFIPNRADAGVATNLSNLMGSAASSAHADGASVENINIYNSALLGTEDSTNPLAIFAFDLVVDAGAPGGPVTFNAEGIAIADWPSFWDFQAPPADEFLVVSDRLLIPAPGSGAALVALIALRRRRGETAT